MAKDPPHAFCFGFFASNTGSPAKKTSFFCANKPFPASKPKGAGFFASKGRGRISCVTTVCVEVKSAYVEATPGLSNDAGSNVSCLLFVML